MNNRTIIFGDVHGCLVELTNLVKSLELRPSDKLVFCGDLVDKGPDSAGVVAFVRALAKSFNVVLVKGNHEEKHERFRKHETKWLETGKTNPIKNAEVLREINNELNADDVAFLETAVLFHELPEHKALVVHAGVPPTMRHLPDLGDLKGKRKKFANQMLRFRFADSDGHMVPLSDCDPSRHSFWADGYDGRFGHVFFGHEPFTGTEPKRFKHATGLDTGCVFGGSLTVAVFEDGASDPHFVSEAATAKWAEAFGYNEE
jgi:diadenosine tetraphosphatase ApaH/serine/threonine PP2A family protein phosphatase